MSRMIRYRTDRTCQNVTPSTGSTPLPDIRISESEAAELAQQVKAVAFALQQRGQQNGYQQVYGELYRRYQIGSYKALPQGKYAEAITWLKAWHGELDGARGETA